MGDKVVVDIYRGSVLRHNRKKVAELPFDRQEVERLIKMDAFDAVVSAKEEALKIPLADREPPPHHG